MPRLLLIFSKLGEIAEPGLADYIPKGLPTDPYHKKLQVCKKKGEPGGKSLSNSHYTPFIFSEKIGHMSGKVEEKLLSVLSSSFFFPLPEARVSYVLLECRYEHELSKTKSPSTSQILIHH